MFTLSRRIIPSLVGPIARTQGAIKVTDGARSLSTSVARLASDGEMFKVGSYPRTPEERERAAKKYNLIPEDYEPYDEGDGWGDYPKLKAVGAFNRDPYDDFDDPFDRRYYGEVLHLDYDLYMWERIDPLEHEKRAPSYLHRIVVFFCIAATVPTLVWLFENYRIHINKPFKSRDRFPEQALYEFPHSHDHHH